MRLRALTVGLPYSLQLVKRVFMVLDSDKSTSKPMLFSDLAKRVLQRELDWCV